MIDTLKRILVGQPLDTAAQQHQRIRKIVALAVFASDPISSTAYATEAIMLVLITVGSGALNLSIPICIAIITLLLIVGFSYRQTIHAYPSGGGAYIVAHENLGQLPGLVAAGSLLIDYVLTVAVSVAAGVFVISMLACIAIGIARLVTTGAPVQSAVAALPQPTHTLTLFLILQAFSAGCTALTGV